MTLGNIISNFRKTHGLSMEKFSDISGLSKAYVSMLERNRTGRGEEPSPSIETYRAVSAAIGIDVDELIRMVDGKIKLSKTSVLPDNVAPIDFSHLKRIPILGRIAAGIPIYVEENIEGYTYTDLNGGAEYFALRVKGDSMDAAGIRDGYIVIVRKQDIVNDGEIAVVLIDDQDATLKRFHRTGDTVTLMPQSTNPDNHPFIYDLKETRVKILGLVVKVEFKP